MKRLSVFLAVILLVVSVDAQSTQKTRRTASNSKEAVTERQISSRFNQGLRAYYTAQYDEAVQAFSGILSDNPKHAPSYYMLARVYAGQQRYTEAESACRQAVKLDKNNIWYQVALAQSLMTNENFKEALPLWEKVCREYPNNTDYLAALVLCYEKTAQSAKAAETRAQLAALQQEDSQKPSVAPSEGSSGNSKAAGQAALKAQQYEKAVAHLEQALREDDTDHEVWEAFSEAVSKSGQWARLTAYEDDLTTLFPQSAVLLTTLADAFLQQGNNEKAVEYYRQALAFSFDETLTKQIRRGLHDAYTRMGDADKAARYRD